MHFFSLSTFENYSWDTYQKYARLDVDHGLSKIFTHKMNIEKKNANR